MRKFILVLGSLVVIAGIVLAYFWFLAPSPAAKRTRDVLAYIRNPVAHQEWAVNAQTRCGDAPFIFSTRGLIGYLWDDSFKPGHRHQGIDVFAGTDPGITAVYAAYDGYLTREADWKSTVIIRIPNDPLEPGRQIWAYYTHMADAEGVSTIDGAFPLGTHEVFVKAGTLLGYQGNFSGTPGSPVGVHLHFSIVKDDGSGNYLNELEIGNTFDPSPYFGLPLNAADEPELPILCKTNSNP
jgi:murein DD-endopeptidase MepM/ murein hydrolase activator NlpD